MRCSLSRAILARQLALWSGGLKSARRLDKRVEQVLQFRAVRMVSSLF